MKSDREIVEAWYDEITRDRDIVGAMVFCDACGERFKDGDMAWIKYGAGDDPVAHCEKCVQKKIDRRVEERNAPYGGLFAEEVMDECERYS